MIATFLLAASLATLMPPTELHLDVIGCGEAMVSWRDGEKGSGLNWRVFQWIESAERWDLVGTRAQGTSAEFQLRQIGSDRGQPVTIAIGGHDPVTDEQSNWMSATIDTAAECAAMKGE